MALNPETREAFRAYYRPKLFLLLVVYLIYPTSTPQLDFPISVSIKAAPLSSTPEFEANPAYVVSGRGDEARGWTETGKSVEIIPLTQGYQNVEGKGEEEEKSTITTQEAKFKDDGDGSFLRWLTPTDVSSRPARPAPIHYQDRLEGVPSSSLHLHRTSDIGRQSDTSETFPLPTSESLPSRTLASSPELSECPVDFRGRPLCPNTTREPLSIRKRSSELAEAVSEFGHFILASLHSLFFSLIKLRISPFFLLVLILHVLHAVEFGSLVLEDKIIRTKLSNPLPPDFPRAKSLGKRLERLRWRWKGTYERFGWEMRGIALAVVVVFVIGWECWSAERRPMWEDVPFAGFLLPRNRGKIDTEEKVAGPLRDLVVLEVTSALLSIVAPLKHLLPASILPSGLAPPPWLFNSPPVQAPTASFFPRTTPSRPSTTSTPLNARSRNSSHSSASSCSHLQEKSPPDPHLPPPLVCLDTLWLLSLLIEILSSCITLLQFASLILILPSYSPLTFAPHIIFHCARSRVAHVRKSYALVGKTVECLRVVFRVFPETGGRKEVDREWMCTICFEGESEEGEEKDAAEEEKEEVKTIGAKCSLPCGHKYHAKCLVYWCHFQSFCPICHAPVTSSHSNPITPLVGSTLRERNTMDVFPGNVGGRNRGV